MKIIDHWRGRQWVGRLQGMILLYPLWVGCRFRVNGGGRWGDGYGGLRRCLRVLWVSLLMNILRRLLRALLGSLGRWWPELAESEIDIKPPGGLGVVSEHATSLGAWVRIGTTPSGKG